MKTVFVISFNGKNYNGWQVQPNKPSVQKAFQNTVERLLGYDVRLTGCSRTDSGVHANEYFCHIDSETGISPEKLPLALNRLLPDDISVNRAFLADDGFHSRYSATGKEYVYVIWNSRLKNVFWHDVSFRFPRHIDVDYVNSVAADFCGTHDFSSFVSARGGIEDTVRTIKYFRTERDGDFIKLYICADGFLYNMVRIMVGTVLQTMTGTIKIPIKEIIAKKDRSFAGMTAPPQGLYLNRVFY